MTNSPSRFRVRSGDLEIEYEGPADAVESRYSDALKLLQTKPLPPEVEGQANHKKASHGGLRVSVISEALDALIAENWFKSKRSKDSVVLELQNRRVPGVDNINAGTSLARRVRARKLKSIKDNGDWIYWTD